MKKHKHIETKQTHFRLWKSGKKWLYASSALALLAGGGFVVEVTDVKDDIVESTQKFFKDITTIETVEAQTNYATDGAKDIWSSSGQYEVTFVPVQVTTNAPLPALPKLRDGSVIEKAYLMRESEYSGAAAASNTGFAVKLNGVTTNVPFTSNRILPKGAPNGYQVYSDITSVLKNANVTGNGLISGNFSQTVYPTEKLAGDSIYFTFLIIITSHPDLPQRKVVINDFAAATGGNETNIFNTDITLGKGYKFDGEANIFSTGISLNADEYVNMSVNGQEVLALHTLSGRDMPPPAGMSVTVGNWNSGVVSGSMSNVTSTTGTVPFSVKTVTRTPDVFGWVVTSAAYSHVGFVQKYVDDADSPMSNVDPTYADTSDEGEPGDSWHDLLNPLPAPPGYSGPTTTSNDNDELFNDYSDSVVTHTYTRLPQKTNLKVVGGGLAAGTTEGWLSGKTGTASSSATKTYTAPIGYHIVSIKSTDNGDALTIPTISGDETKTAVIGVTKYGADIATDSSIQINLRSDTAQSVVNYFDGTAGDNLLDTVEIKAQTDANIDFSAANTKVTDLEAAHYVVRDNTIPKIPTIYNGTGLFDYDVTLLHDTEVRTDTYEVDYTVDHDYTDNTKDRSTKQTVKVTRTYYVDLVTGDEITTADHPDLYAVGGDKDTHPAAPVYELDTVDTGATLDAATGMLQLKTVNKDIVSGWSADKDNVTPGVINLSTQSNTGTGGHKKLDDVKDTIKYTPLDQKTDLTVIGGPDAGTTDGWLIGRTGEASSDASKTYTAPTGYHIVSVTSTIGGAAGTTGDNLSLPLIVDPLTTKSVDLGVIAYGTDAGVDSTITIILAPDAQLMKVNFVDGTKNNESIDTVTLTGETDGAIDYTLATAKLNELETAPNHYVALDKTFTGAPTKYDNDGNTDQNTTVTMLHDTEARTETFVINYIVHHDYTDDSADHKATETVTVTRTFYVDLVTGKEVPAGADMSLYAVGKDKDKHPVAPVYALADGDASKVADFNAATGVLQLKTVAKDTAPGYQASVPSVTPDQIDLKTETAGSISVEKTITYTPLAQKTDLTVNGGPTADDRTAWLTGVTNAGSSKETYTAPAGYHITAISSTDEGDMINLPDVTANPKSVDLEVSQYGTDEASDSVITVTLAPDDQVAHVYFVDQTDDNASLGDFTLDGVSDDTIDYTGPTAKLADLVTKHYVAVSDTLASADKTYDTDGAVDQDTTVTMLHDTAVRTDTYQIDYTVHHVYTNSSKDHGTIEKMTVTRTYYWDLVADKEVPAGANLSDYALDGDATKHPVAASYALAPTDTEKVASFDKATGKLQLKTVDADKTLGWQATKDAVTPQLIDLSQEANTGTGQTGTVTVEETIDYQTIAYQINYKNADGTVFTNWYGDDATVPYTYTVEDEVFLPGSNTVNKPGYIFLGWYESPDFSGDAIMDFPVGTTGDKTYYAKWKADQSLLKAKDIVKTIAKDTTYKWHYSDHEPVLYDEDGVQVEKADIWAIIKGKVYSLSDFEDLPEGVYDVTFTNVNPVLKASPLARMVIRAAVKEVTTTAKVTILAKDEADSGQGTDKADKTDKTPTGDLPTTGQPQTKAPLAGILPNTGEAHTVLGALGVLVFAVFVAVLAKLKLGKRD